MLKQWIVFFARSDWLLNSPIHLQFLRVSDAKLAEL